MSYKLGKRSLKNLRGVHPDLKKVVQLAIRLTKQDFTVLEGVRSESRQRYLYKTGKSKTLNSRHLTGHAVDIAPWVDGKVSWDWDHYWALEAAMKEASQRLGIPIEWGGDWKSPKDGPHWQLPWRVYPK